MSGYVQPRDFRSTQGRSSNVTTTGHLNATERAGNRGPTRNSVAASTGTPRVADLHDNASAIGSPASLVLTATGLWLFSWFGAATYTDDVPLRFALGPGELSISAATGGAVSTAGTWAVRDSKGALYEGTLQAATGGATDVGLDLFAYFLGS